MLPLHQVLGILGDGNLGFDVGKKSFFGEGRENAAFVVAKQDLNISCVYFKKYVEI